MAHWFNQHDPSGFPVEKAAFGAYDLSVLFTGGEWQWLVRCDGRDVAGGAAVTGGGARRAAIAVDLRNRSINKKSAS